MLLFTEKKLVICQGREEGNRQRSEQSKTAAKTSYGLFWRAFAKATARTTGGLKRLIQLISLLFSSQPLELNWRRERGGGEKDSREKIGEGGWLEEEIEEECGRESACILCVWVCVGGGVCKSRGTLWGTRQHPAVPSNGRIELNRVEKGWRLLTQKWSF